MLRIVVAEDSSTMRALLVAMLACDPGIVVVGQARTGREAVELTVRLRPDVVTMDIEMPELDGLAATREIMIEAPTPIVIVSSPSNRRQANLSLDATEAGALCVIDKPGPSNAEGEGFQAWGEELRATVKAMAQVKVVRRWRRRDGSITPADRNRAVGTPPVGTPPVGTPPGGAELVAPRTLPVRVVAIAASTGGPAVLHRILRRLPADLPAPILVVQHIAHGFVGALAEWMRRDSRLGVTVAADGEPLRPGTVYIAPDGRHLGIGDDGSAFGAALLAADPPIGGFQPSATYLFASAAARHGAGVLAVMLSGMGGDGVEGLRHVHAAGGLVLAQDERSCVVFGMPREAIAAGVVDAVLDPDAIADRLSAHRNGERA